MDKQNAEHLQTNVAKTYAVQECDARMSGSNPKAGYIKNFFTKWTG